jgi:hypothetical protein
MSRPATDLTRTNGPSGAADWFAIFGGALAWLAHLLGAYAIAEFGCIAGLGKVTLLQITAVAWLLIGLSVVMAGVAFAAVAVSLHRRRQVLPVARDRAGTPAMYISRLGFIAGVFFTVVIVAQSIPIIFYLGRC